MRRFALVCAVVVFLPFACGVDVVLLAVAGRNGLGSVVRDSVLELQQTLPPTALLSVITFDPFSASSPLCLQSQFAPLLQVEVEHFNDFGDADDRHHYQSPVTQEVFSQVVHREPLMNVRNTLTALTTLLERPSITKCASSCLGADVCAGTLYQLDYRDNEPLQIIVLTETARRFNSRQQQEIDAQSTVGNDEHRQFVGQAIVRIVELLQHQRNVGLAIFLNTNITAAIEAFGDPSCAVTYENGSHFNQGLTLKALIQQSTAQASTLQAHLLNKGIEMRTLDLRSFSNTSGKLWPWNLQNMQTVTHPGVSLNESLIVHLASESQWKWTTANLVRGSVPVLEWNQKDLFTEYLVERREAVILRHSAVTKWQSWTMDYLREQLARLPMNEVKRSAERRFFDPDRTAAFAQAGMVNLNLTYDVINMTSDEFFAQVDVHSQSEPLLYYFDRIPRELVADLNPVQHLFLSPEDEKRHKQYIWISSAGVNTHTHVDQDHNFFVQMVGRKKFTLFPASELDNMYMYPRVHPMWHKSQVDFAAPDLERFPNYRNARAYEAVLEPGDLLYVPPFTWHFVETYSTSVSLSTWSHEMNVYTRMNHAYKYDHKFDLLATKAGKIAGLRVYLDLLIRELYGKNRTVPFFQHLIATRFRPLHFQPSLTAAELCNIRESDGKMPMAHHVLGDCQLDARSVASHFSSLKPETRDILLCDFVEEVSYPIVGAENLVMFFDKCFQDQQYYLTSGEEHKMWAQK